MGQVRFLTWEPFVCVVISYETARLKKVAGEAVEATLSGLVR
jgi:hypothetical protein